MRIIVKVKPWAKVEGVTLLLGAYQVAVKAPAQDGKANQRALALLARHFGVSKGQVQIIAGGSGRHKIVEVSEAAN